jgi:2-amino-4-hydroxy-6-hydroxymethyldihydropteridine diphosphokinase
VSRETVVLSLGSNLGDREATLRAGIAAISALDGVEVLAASGIVETPALKPHGVDLDAPAYLNAVVLVTAASEPEQLLVALNAIERDLGRTREVRWGDRTLDIDIVAWGSRSFYSESLTIPHPRAKDRAFVLAPWFEVDPHAELGGIRIATLLDERPAIFDAEPLL